MKPTTDEVLAWAREAGVDLHPAHGILVLRHSNGSWIGVDDVVEILTALAYAAGAADMKERCAKEFDRRDGGLGIGFYDPHEPAEIIRALPINPLTAMNRAAEQNGEEL